MAEITLKIKPFGAFRTFGDSIELSVPSGSSIATIKTLLQTKLNDNILVSDSVLADNDAILRDEDILDSDTALSILPPVCGG